MCICTNSDKVTPSVISESNQEEETNMRSPPEIKEEEIPVNINEDVKPPVVSKVEQEVLNIRDRQQVKEEESPGNIREGPQDGDLYPDLYSERDEKSIHQMGIHSDPCTVIFATGYASGHPENISTMTNAYSNRLLFGI
ncbi:uncharacterized protein O3C94_007293 [Discoglossus pictus]